MWSHHDGSLLLLSLSTDSDHLDTGGCPWKDVFDDDDGDGDR